MFLKKCSISGTLQAKKMYLLIQQQMKNENLQHIY